METYDTIQGTIYSGLGLVQLRSEISIRMTGWTSVVPEQYFRSFQDGTMKSFVGTLSVPEHGHYVLLPFTDDGDGRFSRLWPLTA